MRLAAFHRAAEPLRFMLAQVRYCSEAEEIAAAIPEVAALEVDGPADQRTKYFIRCGEVVPYMKPCSVKEFRAATGRTVSMDKPGS